MVSTLLSEYTSDEELFIRYFQKGWKEQGIHSHRRVGQIIDRLKKGESIEEIHESFERERAKHQAEREAEDKKQPENIVAARTILEFANSGDIPDFITDAVLVAISGAATASGLPDIFMHEEDTDETEAPKLTAIITKAGKSFSLKEALNYEGYSRVNEEGKLDEELVTLSRFTDMVEILGLKGTRDVLKAIQAGSSVKELRPLIERYAEEQANRPAKERAKDKRRAEEFAASVRAMKERGEL